MYSFAFSVCSSLVKVFSADDILPPAISSLSVTTASEAGFTAAMRSDADEKVTLTVEAPFETQIFLVGEIPSDFPIYDDQKGMAVLNEARPGLYPDLLVPSGGTTELKANESLSFYIRFGAKNVAPGTYTAYITAETEHVRHTSSLEVRVYASHKPEKQVLRHINWFHTDCLSSYYKVPVFSEKHWEIIKNFAKNAFEHGVNVLFTPLFTPPLDTAEGGERPTVQLVKVTKTRQSYDFDFTLLDRWLDMAKEIGFEYFEFSHLFTQWGAKHAPKIIADTLQGERRIFGWDTKADDPAYENFLSQFGAALTAYTDARGITENCYIHCSDEPGLSDILKYRKSAEMVKKYFGGFRHIDALSDYAFYKSGLIDLPVPEQGSIEKFAGKVPELWTYYCCGSARNNQPNRLFVLPSVKNRMLGTLLYKYNCAGFLQWGFNFYYTQYSKAELDPFKVTDAGGAFPSGDAFVVYPGEDGRPLSSIRQQVFYDGIIDYEALRYLESLSSREETLEIIKRHLSDISFSEYPLDEDRLPAMMSEVYERTEALLG